VAGLREHQIQVEANVRRLRLTAAVVDEVHDNLVKPVYPDKRADLLIEVENLAESVFHLLEDIREMVWEDQHIEPTEES
jgi:hypothetical protein